MKRSLTVLAVVCLMLAATASGSVEKGDVEIEFMGGWAIEQTESADVEGVAAADFRDFLSEGTGTDLNAWFLMGGLGRFTSQNFQVAIAGFYTDMEGDTETFTVVEGAYADVDQDVTAYGIGGRAKWHFNPANKWVPYVGAQVFWAQADIEVKGVFPNEGVPLVSTSESDDADGILWGPVVGLRAELSERNELLLEYQYHLWAGDVGDVIEDGHALFVGLSHRWD